MHRYTVTHLISYCENSWLIIWQFNIVIKNMDSEIGLHKFESWPQLFICSVIYVSYLNSFVPSFPHLQNIRLSDSKKYKKVLSFIYKCEKRDVSMIGLGKKSINISENSCQYLSITTRAIHFLSMITNQNWVLCYFYRM